MALLDVSELIGDPDFCEPDVTVIHRPLAVGDDGLVVRGEIKVKNVQAAIFPASGDTLRRLPEGLRVAGSMQIWSREILVIASPNNGPDEVLWRGQHYVVTSVTTYENWGRGYSVATMAVRELVQPDMQALPE